MDGSETAVRDTRSWALPKQQQSPVCQCQNLEAESITLQLPGNPAPEEEAKLEADALRVCITRLPLAPSSTTIRSASIVRMRMTDVLIDPIRTDLRHVL